MSDLSLIFPESSRSLPAKGPLRVLGIDLGTTNSSVAEIVWDARNKDSITARCLEIKQITLEGDHFHVLVPSVVALLNGKELVGAGAKQLRARATEAGLEQNRNIFYDCKNDIGILRTYHKAPEGYREAAEIGGRVLKFLHDSAVRETGEFADRVVVTVPASFQAAQRRDTLHAASLAGMKLSGGDLLDEPVAAFLDYIITNKGSFSIPAGENRKLLVFDFGGGTCDVAVFRLESLDSGGRLHIAPLAVSRYHRLGGGDIDAAILYEVLLPQIIKQNGLSEFELGFTDKKRAFESSFIGIAESLKIGLCNEIARLRKMGAYDKTDKSAVINTQPGSYACRIGSGCELLFKSPSLTAEQFDKVLTPFLDRELLYARETEYRITGSIFAPLQDALDRSELDRKEIDYCLLVGGSCLIPQVVDAAKNFFTTSEILTYDDVDSIQTAVARGAAYHALSLSLYNKPLIQPVCHDTISIRTQAGPVDLIPKGAELPYPSNGSYARAEGLAVPETSVLKFVELRVEVIARKDDRTLISGIYQIPGR